ncbi:unnamed protein product, partial [Staurois parvus]
RVGSKRANRIPGESGREVRNSRGQDRRSSLRVRIKQNQESSRKQTGCRYRGSWETLHQGPDHRPGHSLNIPAAISLR